MSPSGREALNDPPRHARLRSRGAVGILLVSVATLVSAACGGDGGGAQPPANAVLTGPIDITENASGGTITLSTSEDGSAISWVEVELRDVDCNGFSAASSSTGLSVNSDVSDGSIDLSVSRIGKIEGRFTSSTRASGTIEIVMNIPLTEEKCELGTWDWTAEVVPGATPEGPPAPLTEQPPPTMPTQPPMPTQVPR
jgi:hypothetical protein